MSNINRNLCCFCFKILFREISIIDESAKLNSLIFCDIWRKEKLNLILSFLAAAILRLTQVKTIKSLAYVEENLMISKNSVVVGRVIRYPNA